LEEMLGRLNKSKAVASLNAVISVPANESAEREVAFPEVHEDAHVDQLL
jgi:hypothetical protein